MSSFPGRAFRAGRAPGVRSLGQKRVHRVDRLWRLSSGGRSPFRGHGSALMRTRSIAPATRWPQRRSSRPSS